jgi:hypothetical protein
MTRVLALADEVHEAFYGPRLKEVRPNLVVACGDLPFEYLEYIVTMLNVPLLFVAGNHDPDVSPPFACAWPPVLAAATAGPFAEPPGPGGCTSVDGRVQDAAGLRVAGLGGSVRYSSGPNQYTQREMRRRALKLERRHAPCRLRHDARRVDVLVTHAPPAGVGDGRDPAHRGFEAFHRLLTALRPKLLIHGHVPPLRPALPRSDGGRHPGGQRRGLSSAGRVR